MTSAQVDGAMCELACSRVFNRYRYPDGHWPAFSRAWREAVDWALNQVAGEEEAVKAHSLVLIPRERLDLYRAWTEGAGEAGVFKRSQVTELLDEIERLDFKIQGLRQCFEAELGGPNRP